MKISVALEFLAKNGYEAFEMPDYLGAIVTDNAESSPIMVYISKAMIEKMESDERGLPFSYDPELVDEMNLGILADKTRFLWGEMMPEPVTVTKDTCLSMPGFILTEPDKAKDILLDVPGRAMTGGYWYDERCITNLPTIFKSHNAIRAQKATFCSCKTVDIAENERVYYVFPLGFVNDWSDVELGTGDEKSDMGYRAAHAIRRFQNKQLEMKKEQEKYENTSAVDAVVQFNKGAERMQAEFDEMMKTEMFACSFIKRYYALDNFVYFSFDGDGRVRFMDKDYDAHKSKDAWYRLLKAFDGMKQEWQEYSGRSLSFGKYRGFLQAYPVEVDDLFGQFCRKRELPRLKTGIRIQIGLAHVTLIKNGAVLFQYESSDNAYEAFKDHMSVLARQNWKLRLATWLYWR